MKSEDRFVGILFADIMISFAAFLFCLFIVIAIQPHGSPTKGAVDAGGKICVELFWDNNRDIDLDLWGRSPIDNNSTGYTNMHTEGLNLFKDTYGFRNNPEHINMEIMCSNGIYPGRWVFNTQYYMNHETPYPADKSVVAKIIVRIQNKKNEVIFLQSTTSINPDEEKTFFNFEIDDNGNVVNGSVTSKSVKLKGL